MNTAAPLAISDAMKQGALYRLLQSANSVCFVGDSLTEGTINGGIPWYAPLKSLLPDPITNISQGGLSAVMMAAYWLPAIASAAADLFVVAVGANDILFQDPAFCAMTPAEYIASLKKLRDAVQARRPGAKFLFLPPWIATEGDASIIGRTVKPDTDAAYAAYTKALQDWSAAQGDAFADPTEYIRRHFALHGEGKYLLDFIHPNARDGVQLYAAAVLLAK